MGKIILKAGQFALCVALNETPVVLLNYITKNH